MPAPVHAGATWRAGLRNEALATYRRHYDGILAEIAGALQTDVPSSHRSEFYVYWESAPHMRRWAYDEGLPYESFKGIQFETANHRWAGAVTWEADDEDDDVTQSLVQHARGVGESSALLVERTFFQVLLNSTDGALLPSIPNAPDGSALFLGTTRFGLSTGNIVSGGGVTTDALVRTDYWKARQNFRRFQDTKGQPLFGNRIVDGPALVIYGAANEERFQGAFGREIILGVQGGNVAGISDEIRFAQKVPVLLTTSRITDNDWYVALRRSPVAPVFEQMRMPLQEVFATEQNSDRARDFDQRSIRFKMRFGIGVHIPYGIIKVDNA